MKPLPRAVLVLVTVSVVLSLPYVALGALDVAAGRARLDVVLPLLLLAALLSLRPIRVQANTELSPSDVAVLVGIVLLPPGAVAIVAGGGRLCTDIVTRKRPVQVVRNVVAVILATGTAALAYRAVLTQTVPMYHAAASTILSGVVAVVVLVALDVSQIVLLQRALGHIGFDRAAARWVERTARAQLLWSLAAIIVLQVVLIEPWFLVPAVPLLLMGYLDIRARFAAERRARLLATLVEIGHAVGMSLDPTTVFREVFAQVRNALDVDAFYVAIADQERGMLSFRYLYENGHEMEPAEQRIEGTLAGICIERDRPILLRDAERDRARLNLPPRSAWGTLVERSLMVAPLRLQGRAVGAISVQSAHANAYDEGDLELLAAIGNEAATAIERADLYERTTALSRRLFDLHRLGVELSTHKELGSLVRAFAQDVERIVRASAVALYLDKGGDDLEFSVTTGHAPPDVRSLSKTETSTIARVIETGGPVEVHDRDGEDDRLRASLRRFGYKSVYCQPMRVADRLVGVVFVTWQEPHRVNAEERELLGVLAGIGAAQIRGIQLYKELDDAYLTTVGTLTATIEARDQYREDHQRRVAADAVALGERLGFSEAEIRDLRYASLFHAIGKIAIPGVILAKRGPLTPDERAIVEEHPILGARILESIRFLRGVVPIVRSGRESWDGTGYPDKVAGEAIPRAARVLRVVVDYHAMLVDRPYRVAVHPESALAELRRLAGTRYDPHVVAEFAAMIEARGTIQAVEEEVGQTSRELSVLAELTPEFHTLLDLQQLLDRILQILQRNIPGASFTILLRDEKTDDLVVRAAAGMWTGIDSPTRVHAGRGISGWVLEHREAQNIEDVRLDPRYVGDPSVRSEMIVPLVSGGRAIGVLVLSHRSVGAFSQRDLMLMQTVGAQIAAAIDVAELHERLKRAANTDALTGLHNYRYFYDRLEEEIARAERRQAPLAVAFFDLDKLKSVNDTYGHLAGNEVLRLLGQTISGHVRTEDVPARYGGDEFAIVMPDTPRDEAEKVVVRLMEILEETTVDLPNARSIPMPELSWGVASYPLDGRTARELVENADTRAYARKRSR
ncbi:MAG TPA: GAF domain-containing protein [Candidatus Limnocylindria bacterium]|nr:GAF domain-containing protein [Candidatus Limnocylindria bacterium]